MNPSLHDPPRMRFTVQVAQFAVRAFVILANAGYAILKLLPVRNKVAFITWNSSKPTLDFRTLIERLRGIPDPPSVVVLCRELGPGFASKVRFAFHLVRQMFHMATSRVIVLDTYSLLACALTHRRQLRVVQLWHALGAFKKFGWAVVDKEEGWAAQSAIPARALSRLLHMHRGYTDIVVSHSNFIGFYAEAFNADPSVFRVAWLPRVDLMRDQTKVTDLRTRILAAHPELEGQKVVMYAPTIRRPPIDPTAVSALIDAVSDSTWKLIVKMHPIRGQQTPSTTAGAARVDLPDFSAFELIAIADAVITDYSAITYEAYLRGTPVYFYTPDMADYDQARGFYTSPDQFPARTYTDPQDLVRDLESGVVDHIGIRDFVATFLEDSDRRVDLLDLIVSKRQ